MIAFVIIKLFLSCLLLVLSGLTYGAAAHMLGEASHNNKLNKNDLVYFKRLICIGVIAAVLAVGVSYL